MCIGKPLIYVRRSLALKAKHMSFQDRRLLAQIFDWLVIGWLLIYNICNFILFLATTSWTGGTVGICDDSAFPRKTQDIELVLSVFNIDINEANFERFCGNIYLLLIYPRVVMKRFINRIPNTSLCRVDLAISIFNFNLFHANGLFLYYLKTSENQKFLMFSRGIERE